ncbi:MAG TPA: ATP-binding protein [Saprospiraceae bacterium]|nr:ATP-binding protein [Saprospiraceae bacterium]HPI05502.1 ATP-binding protein [Saprospiraceae bacterium]
MIIEFAATNFRSINERAVLDFRLSGQVGKKELSDNLIFHSEKSHGDPLLRTALIYGANASGKSNLLKALLGLEYMVINSHKWTLDSRIPTYEPFKLKVDSLKKSSILEVDFIAANDIRYIYKVEYDFDSIISEELYMFGHKQQRTQESLIFSRKKNLKITFGADYRGRRSFSLLKNQLLLSRAAIEDIPILVEPYRFFSTYLLNTVATNSAFDELTLINAAKIFDGKDEKDILYQAALVSMIKAADVGISDIYIKQVDESEFRFPEAIPEEDRQKLIERYQRRIKTSHPVYENGVYLREEEFDLSEESLGTRKFLGMATFIIDALQNGMVIVVDELDKSLHPLLSRMLIRIFQNPEMNTKNAQLIFSTHDVSLMDKEILRRDQIYLIDKELDGETIVGRLSNISGISKVVAWQKWYMAGMLRGVPGINDYQIDMKFTPQNFEHA